MWKNLKAKLVWAGATLFVLGAIVIGFLWYSLQRAKEATRTAEDKARSAATEARVEGIKERCDADVEEIETMGPDQLIDAARAWRDRVWNRAKGTEASPD